MTKFRPHGFRRAMALAAALVVDGLSVASAQAVASVNLMLTCMPRELRRAMLGGAALLLGSLPIAGAQTPTPTTLTLSGSGPTLTLGQPITIYANVSPYGMTGQMELWKGTELLETRRFISLASFNPPSPPVGTHTYKVVATYDDTGTYAPPPPASVTINVLGAPTDTTLTASPSVVEFGSPVTLHATVREIYFDNGPITGSVTFKRNSIVLGTAPIADGVATLAAGPLPAGVHEITATYSGAAKFQPSDDSATVTAQEPPPPDVGDFAEFAGNTSGLRGEFNNPAAARLSNGRFVVAVGLRGSPLINSGVYFQIYTPQGVAQGDLRRVKPLVVLWETQPSVAATRDGFVVVFYYQKHFDGPGEILGQRYSRTGAKLGAEFKINPSNPGHVHQQKVAGLDDGGFVVTWNAGPNASNSGEIYAQRYNANGGKVGGQFIANTTQARSQDFPTVASLPNGGFVVAWSSSVSGSNIDVLGQRYAADGKKAGREFKINSRTGRNENAPVIAALNGGGFVAAWTDWTSHGVYARRFDAAGRPLGPDFLVGGPNRGGWEPLALTVLPDDRFLVGWSEGASVYARLFGPTAETDGDSVEFRVNTQAAANVTRFNPFAVALSGRNLFMIWQAAPGGLRLRRLDLPAED